MRLAQRTPQTYRQQPHDGGLFDDPAKVAPRCRANLLWGDAVLLANEVLDAFMDYRILRWEDVVDAPDWGAGGKIRIQRLIAEKPVR